MPSMPFIQRSTRRSSHGETDEADDVQDSTSSSAGFWGSGNMFRKLTPSSPLLLRLTDPDKGEVNALRHRTELWTPDRGPGFYETQRARYSAPHLVTTGKHAGRSRVKFYGIEKRALTYHVWKRDFFTSCINLPLPWAFLMLVCLYLTAFFFWATVWWALWRVKPHCVKHFLDYVSAFVFSVATQQTIGYGDISPANCWASGAIMVTQSIFALLLNAVVLGIVFARISRPGQRGRTIFLSDSAVIARRDGNLKFMFRVADIRPLYQVVHPQIRAHLYTWGPGRVTTEGESIPVQVEELELEYNEGVMLLPIMAQHTIDERSPLWGHSHDSLQAAGAEVVVVFEGISEFGGLFSTRQSYLPREVHWGYQFVQIVHCAKAGSSQHVVDIARFHEVEPQSTVMELLRPSQLSKKVLMPPRGMIPASELATNTLVVSDQLSVATGSNGQLRLAVRIGDTRPSQLRDVHVRLWLYRWHSAHSRDGPDSSHEPFEMHELAISGSDRLCLRLPVIVSHSIMEDSPLFYWAEPSGILGDADSEIVVMVEAVTYAGQRLATRQRTYSVLSDVKTGHRFATMVIHPGDTSDGHPGIHWDSFHTMVAEYPAVLRPTLSSPTPQSAAHAVSFSTQLRLPSLSRLTPTLPLPPIMPNGKAADRSGRAHEARGNDADPSGHTEVAVFGSPFTNAMATTAVASGGDDSDADGGASPQPLPSRAVAAFEAPLPSKRTAHKHSSPSAGATEAPGFRPGLLTTRQRTHSASHVPVPGDPFAGNRASAGRLSRRGATSDSVSSSRMQSRHSERDLTRGGWAARGDDVKAQDSSSSRSNQSHRSPGHVPGSAEATPTTTASAATLSDDPDTWHNTRALRNVFFPAPPQPPSG